MRKWIKLSTDINEYLNKVNFVFTKWIIELNKSTASLNSIKRNIFKEIWVIYEGTLKL